MASTTPEPITGERRLAQESALRRRQAIVAAVAAVALVAAAAFQLSGPQAKVSELTVQLIVVHQRFPLDLLGAIAEAIGLLGLAWTLSFLFDSARARRPEMSPATRIAMISGAVVSAVGGVIYAAILAVKANDFVSSGQQTYQQAHALTTGALLPIFQTLDIAAQFALEIGLILIALNAMRTGLLTKFMGYCGVVAGIAGMLLIGSPPAAALQIFWIGALGYLFAGRWAGGDPPAWVTGRAEPWPSAAEIRERRMQGSTGGRLRPAPASAGGGGRRSARSPAAPPPPPAPAPDPATAPARSRAATPKRKRKRRH